MMSGAKAVRVRIRGRVQGVGFRYSLADLARRRGVTGWCRNRPDGSVEALLCGPPRDVDALVAWCRRGPMGAEVEDLEATVEIVTEPPPDFRIRA